jgi:hypothetical protein
MYLMRLGAGDTNIQAKKWAAEAAGYDEQIWRPERALHEILQQTTTAREMIDVEAFNSERHKHNAVTINSKVPASFYPRLFAKEAELKADGIRLRASILRRWLATGGYDVGETTARKLISDVFGHKWGKSGQNNYNYKDRTGDKMAYCKHHPLLVAEGAGRKEMHHRLLGSELHCP